jgi:PAS domain-containing protein
VIARVLTLPQNALARHLALEKRRLDIAVNNMTQSLLLFDSSDRLIVCNKRYIEMFGLSPDIVKPGCRLDLLRSDAAGAGRNNEVVSRTLTVCVGKTSGSSSSAAITGYPPGRNTTFTQPSFFSLNVL